MPGRVPVTGVAADSGSSAASALAQPTVLALLVACLLLAGGCEAPSTTAPASTVPAQPAPSLPDNLPPDADRSNVARQLALLARGLYLTTAGQVRALPAEYAQATWSGGATTPAPEKAEPQTDERIRIRLEEPQ